MTTASNITLATRARRTAVTFAAASLAVVMLATSIPTEAHAGKRERWIAGGIAAGIIVGAVAASAHHKRKSREARWERHVDRCYAAYASYDEYTDTYIDRRGRERRCRL